MSPLSLEHARISQPSPRALAWSGSSTARGVGDVAHQLQEIPLAGGAIDAADASAIESFNSVGAWQLQRLVLQPRLHSQVELRGLQPEFASLLNIVTQRIADLAAHPVATPPAKPGLRERVGRSAEANVEQAYALLGFIGECALALVGSARHPTRLRWRPILFHIRSAGFDELPIVGLLSFLLGIVVAYQGAGQLRQYGANIFVADLVGLSMRTLGIAPLELLVLPKLIALIVVLPLLTAFADLLGVFGGMLMARAQFDVGFNEFLDRFVKAVSVTAYMIGIAKAPVFAGVIATVGCFQGFRTKGGADSVGRQTTRAVVQSIFLAIVADALFSIAFSALASPGFDASHRRFYGLRGSDQ